MNVARLLDELDIRGVTISVDAGDLILEPAKRLPPALLADLRTHKAELLALLIASARTAESAITAVRTGLPWPFWLYDRVYRDPHAAPLPSDLLPDDFNRALTVALPLRAPEPPPNKRYVNPRPYSRCRVCGSRDWVWWETPAGRNWRCAVCQQRRARAPATVPDTLGP